MNDKTALGDRMKFYERIMTPSRFMPLTPVCARMDGKNFSRFTKDLEHPFDENLAELMILMTHNLVSETNACMGYTQSDEINLVWCVDDVKSQIFMDGKRDKMVSLLAATATAFFNNHLDAYLPSKADALKQHVPYIQTSMPIFDARVWQMPTKHEAANYFRWREHDATKNSIMTAARRYFSHDALYKKTGLEMQDMLCSVGINWNDYPVFFKRGTYVQRRRIVRPFSVLELINLPKQHEAHANPCLEVVRRQVRTIAMPKASSITNYADVIFAGEDPILKQ